MFTATVAVVYYNIYSQCRSDTVICTVTAAVIQ